MSDFVPAWAEKALTRPKPFDLAELEALREFYQAWEDLHAVNKGKIHRKQAEKAAETLVEKAMVLRRMKADHTATQELARALRG